MALGGAEVKTFVTLTLGGTEVKTFVTLTLGDAEVVDIVFSLLIEYPYCDYNKGNIEPKCRKQYHDEVSSFLNVDQT